MAFVGCNKTETYLLSSPAECYHLYMVKIKVKQSLYRPVGVRRLKISDF
jgi:hypothetical protein